MAAPLVYGHLDQNDRAFFDHGLADDFVRFAFIRFFEHVEHDFTKNKRPRTGNGRIKLWNKAARTYWIRRAQASQPLPPILRPTWTPPVPAAAPPQPQPASAPPAALTLVASIPSGTVSIAPIAAVMNDADTLQPHAPSVTATAEAPSADVTIVTEPSPSTPVTTSRDSPDAAGSKRARDDNDALPAPPSKRRLCEIGGERCPQFVLYNEMEGKDASKAPQALPPARDQRHFIQETLGGNWRFAETLHQRPVRHTRPTKCFPTISAFLFVNLDDNGIITDRVVVKCADVTNGNADRSRGLVTREEEAAHAIHKSGCQHMLNYREPGGNPSIEQTLRFRLEGLNDLDSSTLHYMFTTYAPHGDLGELIGNHRRERKIIPEHFCWFVFRSLVDALITCQTGYCDEEHGSKLGPGARREGWRRMLHLDIKPDNVFISGSDSKYACYKRPILADFNVSLCLNEDPEKRRKQISTSRFVGAQNWQAPETCAQYYKDKHYTPATWDLDHATDVYTVGLTIRYMMLCTVVTSEKPIDTYLGKYEADMFGTQAKLPANAQEYKFKTENFPHVYSLALIDTVQRCLAFRPKPDPLKPDKKFRPNLFWLRDTINANLARLDQMLGNNLEAAQNDKHHPLHVLFPEEDQQLAIGAQFAPPPKTALNDLVTPANEQEKKDTRESWNRLSTRTQVESPTASAKSMQDVLDTLLPVCRQDIQTTASLADRETLLRALEHAIFTISKVITPHGTFKQYRRAFSPSFFAPGMKRDVLLLFKKHASALLVEMRAQLPQKQEDKHAREEDVVNALRAKAQAEIDGDEHKVKTLSTNIEFLYERNVLKESEEQRDRELIAALMLFCEALDVGLALLVLGRECGLGESVEEEHWVTKLSALHAGVWEYFWAVPDGVFV